MKRILLFLAFLPLLNATCERDSIAADTDYVIFGRIYGDADDYVQTYKYVGGQLFEDDMPNKDKIARFKPTALDNKRSDKVKWLMTDLTWTETMQGTHNVGECNSCIDKSDFYIEWAIGGKNGNWKIGELRENEITTAQKVFIQKLSQAYNDIRQ